MSLEDLEIMHSDVFQYITLLYVFLILIFLKYEKLFSTTLAWIEIYELISKNMNGTT